MIGLRSGTGRDGGLKLSNAEHEGEDLGGADRLDVSRGAG